MLLTISLLCAVWLLAVAALLLTIFALLLTVAALLLAVAALLLTVLLLTGVLIASVSRLLRWILIVALVATLIVWSRHGRV